METTWNRPVAVSCGRPSSPAGTAAAIGSSLASATRRLWDRWQAERRRAAEQRMLRELSPSVLRDIGADLETIHDAQRRSEPPVAARDAVLRLL